MILLRSVCFLLNYTFFTASFLRLNKVYYWYTKIDQSKKGVVPMRKKWMGLSLGLMLAIGLAACGGGNNADNDNNNTGNDTGGETATNDAEEIVKNNCISCHGENLEGQNGPELAHIGSKLSKDEILDVIENGRPGMPGNLITGDDADKVAQWLSEKK